MGLKQLGERHTSEVMERACQTAHAAGTYRLRTVRELIKRRSADQQQQFEFLEDHPVIRPLETYSQFVPSALRKEHAR